MIRESVQHIDDIEIPVIDIAPGWPAESVKTSQDCDDAFAYLMSACAQIEFQIEVETVKPKASQDNAWLARARCALKYKRAALQIVTQKRGYISQANKREWQDSRDRRLLEYIRSVTPDDKFLAWVTASAVNEDDLEDAA